MWSVSRCSLVTQGPTTVFSSQFWLFLRASVGLTGKEVVVGEFIVVSRSPRGGVEVILHQRLQWSQVDQHQHLGRWLTGILIVGTLSPCQEYIVFVPFPPVSARPNSKLAFGIPFPDCIISLPFR